MSEVTSGYIKLTVKIIRDSECSWGAAALSVQRDCPAGGWSWQGGGGAESTETRCAGSEVCSLGAWVLCAL